MFIQNSLTSLADLYTSQKPVDTSVRATELTPTLPMSSRVTFSRAVLNKQSDGALQWMRFGFPEIQIFKNEETLDSYLSQNQSIDIWEIEDRRLGEPKTLYKWCDSDESSTFSTKEALYREIASTTGHGVFSLYDLNTHKGCYIQQKKGWFHTSFEEVSLEQALETLRMREASRETRCKTTVLGIGALALTPTLAGIGKTLSQSWTELSVSSVFIQKTTTLFTAAILTYGMSDLSKGPGLSLSKPFSMALLGTLSWPKLAKAQLCPVLVGSYNTSGSAFGVAVSGNYAYVADHDSGLQIIDVSNASDPMRVGGYNTPNYAYGVAVSGNYAYVADKLSGLQIIDVSNASNPVPVGSYNTPGYAYGVAVQLRLCGR